MKAHVSIVFENDEQETFSRLLPFKGTLGVDDDGKPTLGRLLSRLIRSAPNHVGGGRELPSEPADADLLWSLDLALDRLLDLFAPQTRVEWWRDAGAPGADDAVEGLAAGRRNDVAAIRAAREIVREALETIQRDSATLGILDEVILV